MAKDVDAGEVVVSSIRDGMKREFDTMMKAQSEMGGELLMGRRRVTRSQNTGRKDVGKLDEEAESGLVDVGIDVGGDLRSLECDQVGEGGDVVPDSKESCRASFPS